MITLSDAGKALNKDRRYLRGLIDGLKIPVLETAGSALITRQDLERLRREIPSRPRRDRKRRSLTAIHAAG